ncbi:hypothetical protein BCJMU39_5144 [Bacillus cereus]|nr:hypothetical protein BCJMU39_5144 [Bacillus cereus]
MSKVRKSDQKEVASDFKQVYKAVDLPSAEEAFQMVKEKWGKKYKKRWNHGKKIYLFFLLFISIQKRSYLISIQRI